MAFDALKDMMFMKYIFEAYPDAMIIQTHRPPPEVLASWCGLVTMLRTYSNNIDKKEIGKSQLEAMKEMVESALLFRSEHPELSHRFIDVKYPFIQNAKNNERNENENLIMKDTLN